MNGNGFLILIQIGHFRKYSLFGPPDFAFSLFVNSIIIIVFDFSFMSQEKSKTAYALFLFSLGP